MLYTVYTLFSHKYHRIYIGYTANLINRFQSHNERGTKDWTHSFRPWLVIYCEYYYDKEEAQKREKQLKGAKGMEWIWFPLKQFNEIIKEGKEILKFSFN